MAYAHFQMYMKDMSAWASGRALSNTIYFVSRWGSVSIFGLHGTLRLRPLLLSKHEKTLNIHFSQHLFSHMNIIYMYLYRIVIDIYP